MDRSTHRRWLLALASTTLAACAPQPPSTAKSASQPVQLGAHQPRRMLGATDLGPLDSSQEIDLLLAMRRPGGADVDGLIRSQRSRGSNVPFLTPSEFGARFGASSDDYAWLISWVSAHGFEVVMETPSRTSLNVRGTVATIEKAFGTRLDEYQDSRGTFRAPATDLHLDATFSRVVIAMMGLDNAMQPHAMSHLPPPQSQANNGPQAPADLQTRYGVDVAGTMYGVHGEGQTLAILGANKGPSDADIDGYVNKYKTVVSFDRTSQYNQIALGGPNRDPDTVAEVNYQENVLDIDMAMALAPKSSVVHVITATLNSIFAQGIPYIVNQIPQAHAASVSYGSCERGSAEYELITLDQMFSQAMTQGQQWFFATGDNGTDGCQDMTSMPILSPGWPTTSIYVVGVGGTQLSGGVEVAWTDGGGGQSEIVDKPDFQIGVGPYPNDGVRDTPDVAALAGDPGVAFYIQGSLSSIEGTSVATPIFASVWMLLDQAKGGGGIRNALDEIYKLGAAGLGFHDITKGSNSGAAAGYSALPGYDLATGWGTPDLPSLIANWTN